MLKDITPDFFTSSDFIVLVAAVVVSWLAFGALLRTVRATAGTAIAIAVIVLVLQYAFGVTPRQLWHEMTQIPQMLGQLITEIVNRFRN